MLKKCLWSLNFGLACLESIGPLNFQSPHARSIVFLELMMTYIIEVSQQNLIVLRYHLCTHFLKKTLTRRISRLLCAGNVILTALYCEIS